MNTYYLLLSLFRRIELKLAALTFLVHITDTYFSYCNSALICYTVDFLRTDFSFVEWSLQLSHHVCYCVHVFRMPAYLVIPFTLHFINDSIYICYPYLMTISVRVCVCVCVCVCVHIANIFFYHFIVQHVLAYITVTGHQEKSEQNSWTLYPPMEKGLLYFQCKQDSCSIYIEIRPCYYVYMEMNYGVRSYVCVAS